MEEGLGGRLMQQIREICEIAGIRTEEAARVGRRRLDVLSLEREVTAQKTALGRRVHELAGLPEPGDVLRDPDVVRMLARIRELESLLAVRATEIAAIRSKARGRMTEVRKRPEAGENPSPATAERMPWEDGSEVTQGAPASASPEQTQSDTRI